VRRTTLFAVSLLLLLVSSCRYVPGGLDETALETAAVQTVAALRSTETEQPTEAPVPTATPDPTTTPKPCSKAEFVSETVPDGTVFEPGETFNKSWRVENTGTCTWNTSYKLVFFAGDRMGGPQSKNLHINVDSGERVDVSIDLEAPEEEGEYEATWKLQDDEGENFGQLFVVIEVAE